MKRALPPEQAREPQRKFEDTFSAEDVVMKAFFPRDTSRFQRFYPEARAGIREDADPHLPYLTSYEMAVGETLIRAKTEK